MQTTIFCKCPPGLTHDEGPCIRGLLGAVDIKPDAIAQVMTWVGQQCSCFMENYITHLRHHLHMRQIEFDNGHTKVGTSAEGASTAGLARDTKKNSASFSDSSLGTSSSPVEASKAEDEGTIRLENRQATWLIFEREALRGGGFLAVRLTSRAPVVTVTVYWIPGLLTIEELQRGKEKRLRARDVYSD